MKSMLVIGLGRFGRHLAMEFSRLGNEVLAVDINEAEVEKIAPHVTSAQIGAASGLPAPTVRTRLRAALKQLKRYCDEEEPS